MSEVRRGYKQTEVGVIPEDWQTKPCSAVSVLITVGIVIRPTQYYVNQGVPALRSANVREDGVNENDMVFISEHANALLSKSQVRTNDVLTVRTGYPGTSAVVPPHLSGANCIDILITRPSKAINSYYLTAWINSPHGKYQVLRDQGGLAQQHFNVGDLRDLSIALPPTIGEQTAIAEALSDADALIESLEQLLIKKRQIKQGAMQELLTGKKRLPGFQSKPGYKQTEVGVIPEDWEVRPLGQLLLKMPSYGINAPAIPFDSRFPTYLRITDITEDGKFAEATKVSVDHPFSAGYMLEKGDIVFARTGASVGKTYLYDPDDGQLVFAGFLIRAKPDLEKLIPAFLAYFVQIRSYWNWVKVNSMRSGQPGINGREYASLLIPLPRTLPEQTAIATVLTDMDADIAALETKLTKARQIKQGMMQNLLTGKIRLV